ncbi:MAG: hypothetical protein WC796_00160 [Candidatus Pacearchaeota archaeon]|jgi:hypothetical protein
MKKWELILVIVIILVILVLGVAYKYYEPNKSDLISIKDNTPVFTGKVINLDAQEPIVINYSFKTNS